MTGGTRGLGWRIGAWMIEQGARHLVLLSRSGAVEANEVEQLHRWERDGVQVKIMAVDVADESRLAKSWDEMEQTMPPIRGMVHAAGLLEDGGVAQQPWDSYERVLSPKVAGAWNLHRLAGDRPLDFFVMFSSAASFWGASGQSNYSAANAFLDGLAHYRRARRLPALSIQWGPWAEIGMAAREHLLDRLERKGIRPLSPRDGLHAFARLLSDPQAVQTAVIPIHWPVFVQQFPPGLKPPFLAEWIARERNRPRQRHVAEKPEDWRRRWDGADAVEQNRMLIAYLRERVAGVLRIPPDQLHDHQSLNTMGVDSLMAVELRNRLRNELGVEMPLVGFLEGLSVQQVAERVQEKLEESPASATSATESSAAAHKPEEPAPRSDQETWRLLQNLDGLSDDEVDALLSAALKEEQNPPSSISPSSP